MIGLSEGQVGPWYFTSGAPSDFPVRFGTETCLMTVCTDEIASVVMSVVVVVGAALRIEAACVAVTTGT